MIILILIQLIWGFLIWRTSRKLYEYSDFDEEDKIKFPIIMVILFWIFQFIPVVGIALDLMCTILLIEALFEEEVYYKHSKLGLKIKNFFFKQI